ncbi:hypothetical protein M3553_22475, partial [Bacillus subtilis]|nr:hypothetical protein [Bacillus subtilis]
LMYNARSYFINGEEGPLEQAGEWLPELANQRQMEAKRFVTLSRVPSMTALLHEWYRAGWIRVGNRNSCESPRMPVQIKFCMGKTTY